MIMTKDEDKNYLQTFQYFGEQASRCAKNGPQYKHPGPVLFSQEHL